MTKIEWCDETINPVVGCSKCSPGCENCYAERFAARLAKNPKTSAKYAGVIDDKGRWSGKISSLDLSCFKKLPIKPRRIFVGSMTDLFHDNVPSNWLNDIFTTFDKYPQHTYIVLTKRPSNLYQVSPRLNVCFGVTVCNKQEADEQIPQLLDFPTSRHFISVEPMLSEIDISQYLKGKNKLYWVIAGGETGKNARPLHPDWVRSLREQCLEAGTPFFFKSWGEWFPCSQMDDNFNVEKYPFADIADDGTFFQSYQGIPWGNGVKIEQVFKVGKKISGHLIDGKEWRQFPK